MPPLSRVLLGLALLAATPAAGALVPTPAQGIGPGSHLFVTIDGERFGCTAGWLFRDTAGRTYLSTAGHCLLADDETATHGPGADANARVSTRVCIDTCRFGGQTGFVATGTTVGLGPVAFARQRSGDDAIGHDFGLIRVPDDQLGLLRPAMPEFGSATRAADLRTGSRICFYGAGLVTGETYATMAREGVGVSTSGPAWRMAAASNVGDSGSAIMDCSEDARGPAAAGILTHLAGGLIAGTTMARGQQLAAEAGLAVTPYFG